MTTKNRLPGEAEHKAKAPAEVPSSKQTDKAKLNRATEGEYENVDHIGRMRELIAQLPDASPSGATTIAQKLTEHLDAQIDPAAYNERQKAIREQHEEDEKVREERRAALKQPAEEKPAA